MAVADRLNGLFADIAFGSGAISDTTAPTVAEIGALTRIECAIVDGPETPRSGSTIDISGLCDTETRQKAGITTNEPVTLTVWREFDGTDAYWTLFDDATAGSQHLVICRAGFTGAGDPAAPLATDIVDVYEVEVMKREPSAPVRNEGQRCMVELAVIQTDFDGVVAA